MNRINGTDFKEMLLSGAAHLSNRHDAIDALNVFPVPDGDTGTNMSMTFTSGVKEAMQACTEDLSLLAKTLSKGLLMGARGNSGVILSQIFRGFYQSIEGKSELTPAAFGGGVRQWQQGCLQGGYAPGGRDNFNGCPRSQRRPASNT